MPSRAPAKETWQDRLRSYCIHAEIKPPHYQMFSDRRGGRTAWSSEVTIGSNETEVKFKARYWYDHKYDGNAREDAAELAMSWLQASY